MVALNFNAAEVAPEYGFSAVPSGWYSVVIDESDMKPTKDGAGSYLQLRFNILDGEFVGRKVVSRLNLMNSNATAVQIARGQLSAIAHSVGVLQVGDSAVLHGRPMKIRVKKVERQGEDPSNEVVGYRDINYVPDAEPAANSGLPTGSLSNMQNGPAPAGFSAPPPAPAQPPAPAAPAPAPAPAQEQAPAQPPAGYSWQPPGSQAPAQAPAPAQEQAPQGFAQPPAQPPAAAPAPAAPAQQQAAAQPQAAAAPQGWQPPPAAQQPWAQPPAAQAPAPAQEQAPAAPAQAPAAPSTAQGAPPPWQQG